MALEHAPLGKSSEYPEHYAPELLFPVPRRDNRQGIGLEDGRWPWFGSDYWQAWEISWIRPNGVPAVAWAVIEVPAASPSIIESKSLKLYLNSLNQETFSDASQVTERIEQDLSSASGAAVHCRLHSVDEGATVPGRPAEYQLIDDEPIDVDGYEPCPERLQASGPVVTESLCSHLLKSNCPVTGQPDWGSLLIHYSGPKIDRAGLLAYVVGFRQKQDFHEHCVETVFTELMARCQPQSLTVSAHYTRRGGLDINPWRSTGPGQPECLRLVRQ
ncbi:NADPH-dependent 7-cyano-7-deazaguanine reductase QueF [Marinobacter sp. JSM 1782161]|uniref:NADPH-dependent 7-cyano-7-deazaguanine reductase QueF n=1 Tax=Marinobacter sp. JSM 1782161 TaxID=2685906 RepID=UPI00140337C2|nr:NADPH-dependent 7-cyano-7-deazaguanine reductase QueF [Marinobacter sp. JSM 1782161]